MAIFIVNVPTVKYRLSSGTWLPTNSVIVWTNDNLGELGEDGEYNVIFETSPEIIKSMLSREQWDQVWQTGPVVRTYPYDFCNFKNAPFSRKDVFNLGDVFYVRQLFDLSHVRLMLIEPKQNRVWFCEYKRGF